MRRRRKQCPCFVMMLCFTRWNLAKQDSPPAAGRFRNIILYRIEFRRIEFLRIEFFKNGTFCDFQEKRLTQDRKNSKLDRQGEQRVGEGTDTERK